MSPDEINGLALRGMVGLILIGALVAFTGWATRGDDSSPVLVAGQSLESVERAATTTTSGPVERPPTSVLSPASGTTPAPPEATTTTPPSTAAVATSTTAGATTGSSSPITTATNPVTTTTRPATTTTSSATTTTTGQVTTTTTTVRPTTTTTVQPTTTTVKPTTTTTRPSATTTTVKPTTTTTIKLPPTTTTTTTTLPPTTTTTVRLPGVFVHKFEGHEHEDPGAWEAHIKIEIRDENDDGAPFARVSLNWNGTTPGSAVLVTDKDGKWDDRLGLFSDSAITFRITNVELSGFAYRPSLNEESPTIVIVGPD